METCCCCRLSRSCIFDGAYSGLGQAQQPITWIEETLDASSCCPSLSVLALKTGMKSEKGRRTVCHCPGAVSKDLHRRHMSFSARFG